MKNPAEIESVKYICPGCQEETSPILRDTMRAKEAVWHVKCWQDRLPKANRGSS